MHVSCVSNDNTRLGRKHILDITKADQPNKIKEVRVSVCREGADEDVDAVYFVMYTKQQLDVQKHLAYYEGVSLMT